MSTLRSSPSSSALPSPSIANQPTTSVAENIDSKLQLFLGGSCNPTTWRQNVAIPFLEMNGISYYNPQVDNWTPEAVNLERYAKQNAQILLFVIDKQTRSTVSLVESAFIAGQNRNLILVIYPFEYDMISLIDTSKQTSNMIETRSKQITTSLINTKNESKSFLQSSSTKTSSSTLISAYRELSNSSSTETRASLITTTTNLTSSKFSNKTGPADSGNHIDEDCLEAIHEEANETCRTIKINDEVISLSEFQELRQARHMLKDLLIMHDIPIFYDIQQALKHASHCLKSKDVRPKFVKNLKADRNEINRSLPAKITSLNNEVTQPQQPTTTSDDIRLRQDPNIKDVYLSLDKEDHSSMRSVVIPILKEKGLTYNFNIMDNFIKSNQKPVPRSVILPPKVSVDSKNPTTLQIDDITEFSDDFDQVESSGSGKSAIEKEICAIKSSRVLLFVITNKCRGLSMMVLASYFMALFRNNVVLCVQYLEEPCSIGGETLTENAIADYNRGRVYLCDYAIKSQVPVFSTIHEAIECCSRKCRYNNKS